MTQYGLDILDQKTLKRCPPGFAKSRPGGYRCVFCDRGSYASASGMHHCRVCPYGSTSNTLRTGCGASHSQEHSSCTAATKAAAVAHCCYIIALANRAQLVCLHRNVTSTAVHLSGDVHEL